jgi:hypothetical protein
MAATTMGCTIVHGRKKATFCPMEARAIQFCSPASLFRVHYFVPAHVLSVAALEPAEYD